MKEWFYERPGPAAIDDFVEHTPEDALALITPAKAFINKAKELLEQK